MNCFEKYLVELLQGNIIYNKTPVEVIKQFKDNPVLPVITLDLSGGVTTNYIYHDVENETEKTYFNRTSNININLWCNTEEEREDICNQILNCFYKEKTYHYMYCSQYEDGKCKTSGTCKAKSIINSRSVKNKCPQPELYNYQSLQNKNHIIHGSVIIEPPFDMDEVNSHPPLLRSILRAHADYEEPVITHGVTIEHVEIGDVDVQ